MNQQRSGQKLAKLLPHCRASEGFGELTLLFGSKRTAVLRTEKRRRRGRRRRRRRGKTSTLQSRCQQEHSAGTCSRHKNLPCLLSANHRTLLLSAAITNWQKGKKYCKKIVLRRKWSEKGQSRMLSQSSALCSFSFFFSFSLSLYLSFLFSLSTHCHFLSFLPPLLSFSTSLFSKSAFASKSKHIG